MVGRDATATKERILEAAFEEFATRGFAGSRVDDIAEKAQCNKALLYQYYGDKEALFKHVLECKMAELASLQIDPERFAESAGEFFDFYAKNPRYVRLMMWEALDFGTKQVPNEAERTVHWRSHISEIESAQHRGLVDPKLDPGHTLVTLVGLIAFWFAAPQTARMICGGDPYSAEALKKRRAHVVEIAKRILEVRK